MPEHVPCPNTRRGRVNHVHPPFSERRRKTCWNKKKKKKQQKKAAISRAGSKLQPQQHTGAGPHCSHHNSGAAGHLAFKAHYVQVRTGSKPVGRIPNQLYSLEGSIPPPQTAQSCPGKYLFNGGALPHTNIQSTGTYEGFLPYMWDANSSLQNLVQFAFIQQLGMSSLLRLQLYSNFLQ